MGIIRGTSAAQTLKGTAVSDTLYGMGGDDILYGYGGNDKLDGGLGKDVMRGGTGNDTYYVDDESDQALETVGQGFDTVVVSSAYYGLWYESSIERIVTTNIVGAALEGNDFANRIEGNSGNDYIKGWGGADTLLGFAGNDILFGNAGSDTLTGGTGRDIFVFTDLSRDTITDFVSGTDTIDLGWLMHGSQFQWLGGGQFTNHAGQGRYANGQFQLDINGDGAADLTILVDQVHAGDFTFGAIGYWDY